MSKILDLSNVINVTILPSQSSLGLPNINTVALFSSETPVVSITAGYRVYLSSSDVLTDWGSTSLAYKSAAAFFAQNPNPLGTNGYFVIILRTGSGTEKVETAIARTLNTVFYYGVLVDEVMGSTDLTNLAAYVQTIDKMLFYCSAVSADYAPGGKLDLFRTRSQKKVRGLFYNDSVAADVPGFAAAYASRGLSTDFSGSRTTGTMHLKSLVNFDPDPTMDQTALTACKTAGVDVYANVAGVPCLLTSGENGYFDEVYAEAWFKFALEVAGFNYLRQTNTKIPQTEDGMNGLKAALQQVCKQAVSNGFIAPGTWTGDVFGVPEALYRCVGDVGYYLWSQPVTQQSSADRLARKAPVIQIAIKSAGAIHTVNIFGNVNP